MVSILKKLLALVDNKKTFITLFLAAACKFGREQYGIPIPEGSEYYILVAAAAFLRWGIAQSDKKKVEDTNAAIETAVKKALEAYKPENNK
jgi:hypothetical protein